MNGPRPAGRPWTRPEDKQVLDLLREGMKAKEIARKMKRTIGAIQSRVNSLKRPRKSKPTPPELLDYEREESKRSDLWTSEDDELLRQLLIANETTFQIAIKLGRTERAVKARAHALGLTTARLVVRRRGISQNSETPIPITKGGTSRGSKSIKRVDTRAG